MRFVMTLDEETDVFSMPELMVFWNLCFSNIKIIFCATCLKKNDVLAMQLVWFKHCIDKLIQWQLGKKKYKNDGGQGCRVSIKLEVFLLGDNFWHYSLVVVGSLQNDTVCPWMCKHNDSCISTSTTVSTYTYRILYTLQLHGVWLRYHASSL